jgi:F-box and WD-40 domain protein 1/11
VRTVQAAFGDLPYSAGEDEAEAKKVDNEYFKALGSGQLKEDNEPRQSRRRGNAGLRGLRLLQHTEPSCHLV